MSILSIGEKYGCLEIMDDGSQSGIPFDSKETIAEKSTLQYKCKCCKCGKIRYYTADTIQTKPQYCYIPKYLSNRFTYSTKAHNANYRKRQEYKNNEAVCTVSDRKELVPSNQYCEKWNEKRRKELKQQQEEETAKIASLPRRLAPNYDKDYTGMVFESLEILECVNEALESTPESYFNHRHQKQYNDIIVYKLYRCKCYLCGKEWLFTCTQFRIYPSDGYDGYSSGAHCDCHTISSFQWKVNKLLIENNVPYRVEVSFADLYGMLGKRLLQYDFAVYNEDGTIKCLIECQGEQHYQPVEDYGGEYQHEMQKSNDNLKREYAKIHNIPLIEISYKHKKFETIKKILINEGIL